MTGCSHGTRHRVWDGKEWQCWQCKQDTLDW